MNHNFIHHSQPLKAETILSVINTQQRAHVAQLEILAEVDSTNLYLMRKAAQGATSGSVCLAEKQHAGRGRRGRGWVSPADCNIYLSLLWRFASGTQSAGLSIAMGIAVIRALGLMGIADARLKWPNDVLWQGHKLAGILVDMATQTSGAHYAVIGVGLNVAMSGQQAVTIDQPWIDMQSILRRPIARNEYAGLLIQNLLLALNEFQSSGLGAFEPEWKNLDMLAGKSISLQTPEGIITGMAQGITPDGSLKLLLANGKMRCYQSAEVSVKIAARPAQLFATAEILDQQ